jgi:3-dehydroquinate dehydratase-2
MTQQIHIINGPNLNLLGQREPEIYGRETLADIEAACQKRCDGLGLGLVFSQSNDEGKLVDLIQAARGAAAGLIINAGAYTHTSIALHDALKACECSIYEVHLSNIFARESFRHHSYISALAKGVICGLGWQGYIVAIDAISRSLENQS